MLYLERRSLKSDFPDVHCMGPRRQPTQPNQTCQIACPLTILATLPTA